MNKNILLKDFCENLDTEVLFDAGHKSVHLHTPYISRPGIQLTGFFEYFDNDRIQLIGRTEYSYLSHLPKSLKMGRIRDLFEHDIPCVILTNGVTENDDFVEIAKETGMIIFKSPYDTNQNINQTVTYLEDVFAPTGQIHGVLVEVAGVGILLTGDSGVGKSEIALELIQRGHRLVADDLINLKKTSTNKIKGSCPEILQYFMEIRGVGIIDIKALFGMAAVKNSTNIDVVVNMEKWEDGKTYERLGSEYKQIEILETSLSELTIPVVPGRNLAAIVETIARNFRILGMDYNAGEIFCERVKKFNEAHKA